MIRTTKHVNKKKFLLLLHFFILFSILKNFILHYTNIIENMAATSYDGTCKKCGTNLSVWMEVRINVDGIPKPEVWCIDCVRGNK